MALGIERRRNHFVPNLPLPLQVDLLSLNQEATLMARAPPPTLRFDKLGMEHDFYEEHAQRVRA